MRTNKSWNKMSLIVFINCPKTHHSNVTQGITRKKIHQFVFSQSALVWSMQILQSHNYTPFCPFYLAVMRSHLPPFPACCVVIPKVTVLVCHCKSPPHHTPVTKLASTTLGRLYPVPVWFAEEPCCPQRLPPVLWGRDLSRFQSIRPTKPTATLALKIITEPWINT